MPRLAAALCWALACLAVAGCGSTPTSRFYTVSAVPAPAGAPPVDASVTIGPVAIPAAVDRPQMVVTVGPNQVRLDEFNRWAAPLANNIARVLAENLVGLLGTSRVTTAPTGSAVDYRVVVEVQRFELVPGDAVTFDAVWTVKRSRDGKSQSGRTTMREPAPDRGYDGVAAAQSRAVARLSQDVAGAVRALDRAGS